MSIMCSALEGIFLGSILFRGYVRNVWNRSVYEVEAKKDSTDRLKIKYKDEAKPGIKSICVFI